MQKTVPVAALEGARRALEQVPEYRADTVTKREAIYMLADVIRAAQQKGYRLTAIAELLTKQGITISKPHLQSYLSHQPGRRSGGRKRTRKASGPASRTVSGLLAR